MTENFTFLFSESVVPEFVTSEFPECLKQVRPHERIIDGVAFYESNLFLVSA
jgi:hypothetical protein